MASGQILIGDALFGNLFTAIPNYAVGASGWSSFDKYPRQVADVNGDGRADIIGFGQAATYVSLGQANGTFGNPFTAIRDYAVDTTWRSFNT